MNSRLVYNEISNHFEMTKLFMTISCCFLSKITFVLVCLKCECDKHEYSNFSLPKHGVSLYMDRTAENPHTVLYSKQTAEQQS